MNCNIETITEFLIKKFEGFFFLYLPVIPNVDLMKSMFLGMAIFFPDQFLFGLQRTTQTTDVISKTTLQGSGDLNSDISTKTSTYMF